MPFLLLGIGIERNTKSPVVGIGYAQVRRIENRGALETAHRALGTCGQVFRYAVATGRAQRDPIGDLRGALHPVKGEHFAAITDPKRVGELLRALDGDQGTRLLIGYLKATSPIGK